MSEPMRRPPFDPAVEAGLAVMFEAGIMCEPILPENIDARREEMAAYVADELKPFDHLECFDIEVPGHDGAELTLTVYRKFGSSEARPGIFNIHGGGMIFGDRFTGLSLALRYVDEHDVVVTTVEYRLAPEHQDPVPVEDCYAALTWVAEHAEEIGIDPDCLILAGTSAGGGMAAGTALLARDRGGPALAGQFLLCPMLDDRDATISTQQFDGVGRWNRQSNHTGWSALLGDRKGTDDVSIYAAPSRARDLSGLPPTFLDAGSAEVFRDETVAYASRIWADGGIAELHIWPGGTHGWEGFLPDGIMTRAALASRDAWIARVLHSASRG